MSGVRARACRAGNITHLAVDAIVNAANSTLLGGGGVDGAIHAAAGPELLAECRTLGGCPTRPGEDHARLSAPGAAWVIHTVGPIWRGGQAGEDDILAACYRSSLALAAEHRCATVAFPAISCGVYGFPIPRACRIAVAEVRTFLAANPIPERVDLVCFDTGMYREYRAVLGVV